MRIAYDHQIFILQKHGGVSRYYTRLAENLRLLGQQARLFAPIHRNDHLHHAPSGLTSGIYVANFPRGTNKLIAALDRFLTPRVVGAWNPDIIHETYYFANRRSGKAIPTVVTVYDMIHELFADSMAADDPTRQLKRETVRRADHVICISENTRNDLVRLHGIAREKTSVIHLGFDALLPASAAQRSPAPSTPAPYVLYVGGRSGYKNFDGLLRAFAASSRLRSDFSIIAFGGGRITEAEKSRIDALGLKGVVKQQSGGDAALSRLYAGARAFIYPSLYEGFGLPPLEAMAHECPVISSNTSSMPEVIGGAAEFFDPIDCESIRRSIEAVVYSDARRAELIALGVGKLSRYSWRRCAEETLAVYSKVAA